MFPSKAWIHLHVMNLGADCSVPNCLGMRHCMRNVAIEALEISFHCCLDLRSKMVAAYGSMENLVAFFEQWSKYVAAHLEPSTFLLLVMGGS